MNVLVTGANGQLGMELRERSKGSGLHFVFTDVNEIPGFETVHLDMTDKDAVRIVADSEMIDVIVNCAGYTAVDKAEDDAAFADLLNHVAVANLASVCKERGAALIHISSDYVYSGTAFQPIRETDAPSPASVYGATKLAGDRSALSSGCRAIVLRTAWLYSEYGKNFVKTMISLQESKSSIKVVADQVGTPTYAGDLADTILHIIKTDQLSKTGVYHFTDEGVASWYDFSEAVRELTGSGCRVEPCHTDEYPAKAARPHYSVLDKTLVKSTFGISIPHWRESLKLCLKRLGR